MPTARELNCATSLDIATAIELVDNGASSPEIIAAYREPARALAVLTGALHSAIEQQFGPHGITVADWVAAARKTSVEMLKEADDGDRG